MKTISLIEELENNNFIRKKRIFIIDAYFVLGFDQESPTKLLKDSFFSCLFTNLTSSNALGGL